MESPDVQAGKIGGNLGNLRMTNSSNVFVSSSLLRSASLLISYESQDSLLVGEPDSGQ